MTKESALNPCNVYQLHSIVTVYPMLASLHPCFYDDAFSFHAFAGDFPNLQYYYYVSSASMSDALLIGAQFDFMAKVYTAIIVTMMYCQPQYKFSSVKNLLSSS